MLNAPGITRTNHIIHLCDEAWRLYDLMCAVPANQSCQDEHTALVEHRETCLECRKVEG